MINTSYANIPGELQSFQVQIIYGNEIIDIDASKVFELVTRFSYNRGYVSGYIKLQDTISVFEFVGAYNYIFLRVIAKDCLGLEYDSVYSLTRIEKQNSNHGAIVYCEFIDEFAYALNSTFISAGYKKASTPKVLAGIYQKLMDKKIFVHKKGLNIPSDGFKEHEELVIPGNKSVFAWGLHRSAIDDFVIIDGRNGVSILKSSDLWSKSIDSKIELKKLLKAATPFSIREVSLVQDAINSTLYLPDYVSFFTKSNTINLEANSLSLCAKELGASVLFPQINSQIGVKLTDRNYKSIYNMQTFETIKLKVTLNSGSYIYNLMQKLKIEVPSALSLKGFETPMLNGEYVITAIEDRITAGILNQTLTLSRPGVS